MNWIKSFIVTKSANAGSLNIIQWLFYSTTFVAHRCVEHIVYYELTCRSNCPKYYYACKWTMSTFFSSIIFWTHTNRCEFVNHMLASFWYCSSDGEECHCLQCVYAPRNWGFSFEILTLKIKFLFNHVLFAKLIENRTFGWSHSVRAFVNGLGHLSSVLQRSVTLVWKLQILNFMILNFNKKKIK